MGKKINDIESLKIKYNIKECMVKLQDLATHIQNGRVLRTKSYANTRRSNRLDEKKRIRSMQKNLKLNKNF